MITPSASCLHVLSHDKCAYVIWVYVIHRICTAPTVELQTVDCSHCTLREDIVVQVFGGPYRASMMEGGWVKIAKIGVVMRIMTAGGPVLHTKGSKGDDVVRE